MRILMGVVLMLTVFGCGQKNVETGPGPKVSESTTAAGHSHAKGKMLIADAGRYHALLTAHLSKEGNELDIFFETAGADPKPIAFPLASLRAGIQVRTGEGELREITFDPAPAEERPAGEVPGTCSHYVAKVPWLNPDAEHRVILRISLDGQDEEVRWNSFVPKQYAHHTD